MTRHTIPNARLSGEHRIYHFDGIAPGYAADFMFPVDMADMVSADETPLIPQPIIYVDTPTLRFHWLPELETNMPMRVVKELCKALQLVQKHEYSRTCHGPRPVTTSTVFRFRLINPDVRVSIIREALEIIEAAEDDGRMMTDGNALWVAENYVDRTAHNKEVNALKEQIEELEEDNDGDDDVVCEHEDSPATGANLIAARLRLYGDFALTHRPGATPIERFIDLCDEVAAA